MNGFRLYSRLSVICGICCFFLRGTYSFAIYGAWFFTWLTFIILLLGAIDAAKRASGETDE